MSLAQYKKKRDFKKTPEPRAKMGKKSEQPSFVIQQHAATRLHWDFRLEADGVLKSWAVTKELTMDPSVKRLAVRVEDHPLSYANFHGDIPSGYGAGHVDIWDRGVYEPKSDILAGLKAGKIEVALLGEKLKGMFALVRMGPPGKKENWLLIKMKDRFAKSNPERRGATGGLSARVRSQKKTPSSKRSLAPKSIGKSERIEFTNVDKMMFPEAGLTKGDILKYYLKIADHLLPHLKDRPVTLERLPDGLARPNAPRFWQKNTPDYYPSWIARVELESEDGKRVKYVLVNDVDTLAYLANQGAITFHPFLSRVQDLDHPDYVLFDLDPGDAPFANVVKIAKKLHELLEEGKVESFVKTSGQSGLHVLSPWKQAGGYDEAREWAARIAQRVVDALPELATTERSKAARQGKVYVDVIQNARGHHAVPPYVIRAVPEATVSTPLEWKELTGKLDPKKFTTDVVLKRVRKNDPIAGLVKA